MKLSIRNIRHRFGNKPALSGIDLDLATGRVTGLLGPNGAGKSTLISILARQRPCREGTLSVEDGSWDQLRIGWAATPGALFPDIPLDTFVAKTVGPAFGMTSADAARRGEHLATVLQMGEAYTHKPSVYSQGTKMKGAVLLAFLEGADFIILDEPFNGLDLDTSDQLQQLIEQEKGGAPILISAHQVDLMEQLCDDVAFIAGGRIRRFGVTADFVAEFGTLKAAYRSIVGGAA